MIVLGAAFLAALGLLSYLRFGSRRVLLAVLLFAIAAAATSIYDLQDIAGQTDVASGWGINLDAEASVALAVSAAILLVRPGRSLIAPAPFSTGAGAIGQSKSREN
jgi:hypothetical protein